jgi:cellulose synthase/poly-beta-1,6-N-acetylglucosamine synthase-like glycosyltransferase
VSDRRRAAVRPTQIVDQLGPLQRRAVRRATVLACLLPLSIIVARKLVDVTDDVWVNLYGIAVLTSTMAVFAIAFTRYEDPSKTTIDLAYEPTVSCLVAVHNDEAVIAPCVRSLLDADYPHLEVIVVDDASTDATARALAVFADDPRVVLLSMAHNVGKKRALVEGVRHARGELFVFTDSDCVIDRHAISRVVAAFSAHPDLGAVSGHARALNADTNVLTRIQDVWYDGQFGVAKAAEASFGSVTCVSGPLAAFRREAVLNFFPAWAADRFLGKEFRFATDRQLTGYVLGAAWVGKDLQRAHWDDPLVGGEPYPARRWDIGYVRSARVFTNVPTTFAAMVRQQVRWKKSFVRNLFFTGGFFWRRGLRPALLFYGHALWVVAAPILAFRHLVLLPLSGGVLVTALYFAGVVVKGSMWGLAYRVQNPGDHRWVWRPVMSLLSALVLAWLLPYSILTLRRSVWSRQATPATGLDRPTAPTASAVLEEVSA